MKKDQKGFSLIELMVVIAIMGILAIIAVTALNAARDRARQTAALSTLSGLQAGATLCAEDAYKLNENGKLPGSGLLGKDAVSTEPICEGSETTWPKLPTNYHWVAAGVKGADNDDWYYTAGRNGKEEDTLIACSEEGCVECNKDKTADACGKQNSFTY